MSYHRNRFFRRQILALTLVLVLFLAVGIFVLTQQFKADADDPNIDSVTLATYPNFETISVYGDYVGDVNKNAQMRFEYKEKSATDWLAGIPMTRLPNRPQFASFFNADIDTEYDVRLITTDIDGVGDYNIVSGITKSRNDVFNLGSGKTYYVSPSGSDDNAGTDVNLPLKTINKGAEKVQAGDTVSIMAGTYRERVDFTKSGTANNLITFQSYGDGEVILEGAYATLPRWEVDNPDFPNIYSIDLDWDDESFYVDNLTVDGETVYRFTDLDALKTNEIVDRFGQPVKPVVSNLGWARQESPTNGKISVYLQIFQGDNNPNNHVIRLTRPPGVAFALETANYTQIKGLIFQNYSNGIRVTGNGGSFSNIVIYGNKFIANNEPISVGANVNGINTGNNITIVNNIMTETGLYGLNWSALKGSSQESSGIHLSNMGSGVVVRNNAISGYFNGVFLGSWPPRPGFSYDADIYDNNIYYGGDDGLEIDGTDATNVRMWDNYIENMGTALSVDPVLAGPVYFFRNTANNVSLGVKLGSARASDDEPISTGFVYVYHNTFNATQAEGTGAYCTNEPVYKNTTFLNNIFNTDGFLIMHGAGTVESPGDCFSENVLYDYNLMHSNGHAWGNTSGDGPIIGWNGNRSDTGEQLYYSVSEFTVAHPDQAQHTLTDPPIFQDTQNGDFRLAGNSPGIDFGIPLIGFNTANSLYPYDGNGPDLGAQERVLGSSINTNTNINQAMVIINSKTVRELPATGKIYFGFNVIINAVKILLLPF